MRVGRATRAHPQEQVCGDVIGHFPTRTGDLLMICDGVGHGPAAQEAAMAAWMQVVARRGAPLEEILLGCDRALITTRGVAMMLCEVDRELGVARLAGVGNCQAHGVGDPGFLFRGDAGIVGTGLRGVAPMAFPLQGLSHIILATDGVSGLSADALEAHARRRSPSSLADTILSKWSSGLDDASVLVLRLEVPFDPVESLTARYADLLSAYVARPTEELLLAAHDLGSEMLELELPLEDLVELHHTGLDALSPEVSLATNGVEIARRSSLLLLEVSMSYGLAFRRLMREEAAHARAEAERARFATESRAKSQLMAQVSHELRTPINRILTMLTLMVDDDALPPRVRRDLEVMQTSGSTLRRLLDDLLDTAKAESGKLDLVRGAVPLRRTLRELVAGLTAQLRGQDVEVKLRIAPDVPEWIAGDPERLRQVLSNLLDNARKFTKEGQIEVSCALIDAARLRVSVTDTGSGIAPDFLPLLFEPFTQAPGGSGGTGLGLTLCKQLVALMQGELHVRSTLGEGTTFEVTLPATPAPAEQPERPEDLSARRAGHELLLVDDDEVSRVIEQRFVQSFGYRCHAVGSGPELLRLLQEGARPSAVLLDHHMPGMSGPQTARLIRALPGHHETPLIALTAAVSPEAQAACLEAGMDAHAGKPLNRRTLVKLLDRATGLLDEPWRLSPPRPAPPPPPPAPPPVARRPVLDATVLAKLQALGALQEMADVFTVHSRRRLTAMRAALEDGDMGKVGRLSHALRTTATQLGAMRVADTCARLMSAEAGGVARLMPALEQEVDAVLQAFADRPPGA